MVKSIRDSLNIQSEMETMEIQAENQPFTILGLTLAQFSMGTAVSLLMLWLIIKGLKLLVL